MLYGVVEKSSMAILWLDDMFKILCNEQII